MKSSKVQIPQYIHCTYTPFYSEVYIHIHSVLICFLVIIPPQHLWCCTSVAIVNSFVQSVRALFCLHHRRVDDRNQEMHYHHDYSEPASWVNSYISVCLCHSSNTTGDIEDVGGREVQLLLMSWLEQWWMTKLYLAIILMLVLSLQENVASSNSLLKILRGKDSTYSMHTLKTDVITCLNVSISLVCLLYDRLVMVVFIAVIEWLSHVELNSGIAINGEN